MANEKLVHEKEIEKLQEIILVKESNITSQEFNVDENKLKQSISSNHIQDDDEMVSR